MSGSNYRQTARGGWEYYNPTIGRWVPSGPPPGAPQTPQTQGRQPAQGAAGGVPQPTPRTGTPIVFDNARGPATPAMNPATTRGPGYAPPGTTTPATGAPTNPGADTAAREQAARDRDAAAALAEQQRLWEQSDPNKRNIRYMDETQRAYFTKSDPNGYYRQFVDFFGDPNSNKGQYALAQYAQSQADYGLASSQDESVLFPDILTKEYWDKLDQGFNQLGWRDRGESAPQMNAGRIVW